MYRKRKITVDALRAPRVWDWSVARAPPTPPRTAMKNTTSPSRTQKATNSQVPSTVGADHIAREARMSGQRGVPRVERAPSWLATTAGGEAHHRGRDGAEVLGVGGVPLARGIPARGLLRRAAASHLLVKH